ncbi:MAG: extensin family protein [Pseudomonadota bacterium]
MRRLIVWAALFVGLGLGVWQAIVHPATPLPPEWNPTRPLAVSAPVTPVTAWKLQNALAGGDQCLAVLSAADVGFEVLPNREVSDVCHIRDRVRLTRIGAVALRPLDTRCQIALRLAMWTEHGLVPAAEEIGASLTGIEHLSSFSCRRIRTPGGGSTRMSTHATADAVDIAGFRFAGDRRMRLVTDWNGAPEAQSFLRAAQTSACDWFATVLGPEYNALHADHFHMQHRGWGTCR